MHFEVPKAKSFKEFAGEYLMIVISIATALLLEHAVQSVHHRQVAEENSAKMDIELRANLDEIKSVRQRIQDQKQSMEELHAVLMKDIQDKAPEHEVVAHFKAQSKDRLNSGIHTPTLRHEAWDVAVANGSVSWMSNEAVQRYSRAYANLRDVQSNLVMSNFTLLQDGPAATNILSDLEVGRADARELFHMLHQFIQSGRFVDAVMVDLEGKLQGALPEAAAHK